MPTKSLITTMIYHSNLLLQFMQGIPWYMDSHGHTCKKCDIPSGLNSHAYQIVCVQAHDSIDNYFVDELDGMYALMPNTPLEEVTPTHSHAYFEKLHPTSVELLRVGLT